MTSEPAGAAPASGAPIAWRFVIAASLAFAVLVGLGVWQLQRLAWKHELLAALETRLAQEPASLDAALATAGDGGDVRFLPLQLTGRFRHDRQAGVAAVRDGAPGWRLVTPLEIAPPAAPGSVQGPVSVVLIDRGFIARTPETTAAPPAPPPDAVEEVSLTGLVRPPARPSAFSPPPDPQARVYYTLAVAPLAEGLGVVGAAAPFVVSAVSESPRAGPEGLAFAPPRVEDIANRHLEYALTWFALAASLAGVAAAFLARRPR